MALAIAVLVGVTTARRALATAVERRLARDVDSVAAWLDDDATGRRRVAVAADLAALLDDLGAATATGRDGVALAATAASTPGDALRDALPEAREHRASLPSCIEPRSVWQLVGLGALATCGVLALVMAVVAFRATRVMLASDPDLRPILR
jgi:hypothetical protein